MYCKPKTNSNNYIVKLDSLSLTMRKISLKPEYVEWVNKKLDSGIRARYPLTRTVIKHRNIPRGSSYVPLTDIFSGRLPNSVVIGLVETQAFSGSYHKNPYNFQNFNIRRINLMINSKSFPAIPYEPRFV